LLDNIKKFGYDKPRLVQEFIIPFVAAGRDVIAYTFGGSSGKIAATLIPLIQNVLENKSEGYVIIHFQTVLKI